MLGELGLVNGLDDRTQDPNRLCHVGRSLSRFTWPAHLAGSLGEFAKRVAKSSHAFSRNPHLRFKGGIIGCDPHRTVRGFGEVEAVAVLEIEARQNLFRKDDAEGISDGPNFQLRRREIQSLLSTLIIT